MPPLKSDKSINEFIEVVNKSDNKRIQNHFVQFLKDLCKFYTESESKLEFVNILDNFQQEDAFWFKEKRLFPEMHLLPSQKFEKAWKTIQTSLPKNLKEIVNLCFHSSCCWEDTMDRKEMEIEATNIFIQFVELFK